MWDGEDAALGRLFRSLEDRLGDDVWVVDPARARREPVTGRVATPAGRSPTWWPPTVASSRCRRRPTTRGGRWRTGWRELAGADRRRGRGARPRHDGRHQRAARAAGRHRRPRDQRGLRRPDRDRPPGPARRCTTSRSTGPRRSSTVRHRYEVPGRLDADGRELEPVRPDSIGSLADEVEAVAVCLLHADLEPAHEAPSPRRWRAAGSTSPRRTRCRPSSASTSARSRPWSTPTCGRSVAPTCGGSSAWPTSVLVMTSAGGLVPVAEAAERPVAAAAQRAGRRGARRGARGGRQRLARRRHLRHGRHQHRRLPRARRAARRRRPSARSAGFPVRLPSLDVHTIGAGGGSIARIDAGGALVVGPAQRGSRARPGLLRPGRHRADRHRRRPGRRSHPRRTPPSRDSDALDVEAARAALRRAGVDGRGRDRGRRRGDGAGAARRVGRAGRRPAGSRPGRLRRRRAVARVRAGRGPRHAGGDRAGPGRGAVRGRDPRRAPPGRPGARRGRPARPRRRRTAAADRPGGRGGASGSAAGADVVRTFDCRYPGQSHELPVPDGRRPSTPSTSGATATPDVARRSRSSRCGRRLGRPSPVSIDDLPAVERVGRRRARRCIAEPDCTIWVPDGWRADPGAAGALVLTRTGAGTGTS